MSKKEDTGLLAKYGDIIREEVNVKEISPFSQRISITKIYKPLGSKLSEKFGKDTGKIIQLGKEGKIKELENGRITIFDDAKNEWTLESDEYEIAYEGLDSEDIAIDGNVIAKLDLKITPELAREGLAREISRFLNQMRKDADFNVDDRVHLIFQTDDKELKSILDDFADFLQHEAMIQDITETKQNPKGDIVALFAHNEKNIEFAMKR